MTAPATRTATDLDRLDWSEDRYCIGRFVAGDARGWAWKGMDGKWYWRVVVGAGRLRWERPAKTRDGARRAARAAARKLLRGWAP